MKTIEERAYAYYEGDIELLQTRGWLEREDIEDIVKNAYVQGATEQRAIDDKRIEELLQYLEELEVHYHDLGQYDDGKPIRRVIEYIKAMEG